MSLNSNKGCKSITVYIEHRICWALNRIVGNGIGSEAGEPTVNPSGVFHANWARVEKLGIKFYCS